LAVSKHVNSWINLMLAGAFHPYCFSMFYTQGGFTRRTGTEAHWNLPIQINRLFCSNFRRNQVFSAKKS